MLSFIVAALHVLASSDEDSGNFALVLLLGGPAFFFYVFMRYRNVDKRHKHETETAAIKLDVKSYDEKIKSLTNLSNSRMFGANNTMVTGAAGAIDGGQGLMGSLAQARAIVRESTANAQKAQKAQSNSGETTQSPPQPPPPPQMPPQAPPPSSDGQAF